MSRPISPEQYEPSWQLQRLIAKALADAWNRGYKQGGEDR